MNNSFNINLGNLALATAVLNEKDVRTLLHMCLNYRVKRDNIKDSSYVPTYKELDEGGIEEVYKKTTLVLASKMLFINSEIKKILGKDNGLIDGYVELDKAEHDGRMRIVFSENLISLCDAFADAVDAFGKTA